ncbi:unnamed protein product [Gemmataceae bacterium]|nr:unnamed protein product [Gemmataceae bacterium]VTT98820.1 unnamed protein product [Gemmataceae bacterium]
MGVDLKVVASHFRERRGELLSTAVLRFDLDPALFARLALDASPCLVRVRPWGLTVGFYEDEGLRSTVEDRYGNRLTCTTPADLDGLALPPDAVAWNRAILVFLLALPQDTRIVLFWC